MLPESLQTLVLLTSGGFVSGSWFWISTLMPANTASSYIARDTEKFGIGQYETFTHSNHPSAGQPEFVTHDPLNQCLCCLTGEGSYTNSYFKI